MVNASLPQLNCDPRDPDFYQNPAAAYARWHAESPVFYWVEYGLWCFAGYSDVSALLRDQRFGRQIEHIVSRDTLGWPPRPAHLDAFDRVEQHSLLNLEPPRHTLMRSLVNKAFISREVESLRPAIEQLVDQTLDKAMAAGRMEMIRDVAMPIPAKVIARLVGLADSAVPDLLRWSHAMVKVYTRQQSADEDHEANTAAAEFSDFLGGVIREKRQRPSEDLLGQLIRVQQSGQGLSDDEIISTVVLLLNAGHEATVHLLGNAVYSLLSENQDVASLFRDQSSTSATVQELFRYCSPLHLFTRFALEDVELASGLVIRQGEEIGLLLAAANRDPLRFDNPDSFDPCRKAAAHLSLGAGIHYCVGAVLARMEVEITLSSLFRRFPGLTLHGEPSVRDSYHFHGLSELHLRW